MLELQALEQAIEWEGVLPDAVIAVPPVEHCGWGEPVV